MGSKLLHFLWLLLSQSMPFNCRSTYTKLFRYNQGIMECWAIQLLGVAVQLYTYSANNCILSSSISLIKSSMLQRLRLQQSLQPIGIHTSSRYEYFFFLFYLFSKISDSQKWTLTHSHTDTYDFFNIWLYALYDLISLWCTVYPDEKGFWRPKGSHEETHTHTISLAFSYSHLSSHFLLGRENDVEGLLEAIKRCTHTLTHKHNSLDIFGYIYI